MKKKLVTGALSFLIAALSVAITHAQEKCDYTAKITKINDLMIKAEMDQDIGFIEQYYSDDITIMPNMGPMIHGKEAAIEAELEGWEKGYEVLAFTLKTLEVKSCETFVYEIGTYAIMMEIPGMEEPWADKGKYLTIYEIQKDGDLKLKVDIYNTDVNPWKKEK